jgi:hypothetical protein
MVGLQAPSETWHGPSNWALHPTDFTMNNSNKLITLILVAATAGLASFGLANTEFVARLPLEAFLGITVSLSLVRFAFSDYARRPKPLSLAPVLRPAAPRTVRVSACVERIAA